MFGTAVALVAVPFAVLSIGGSAADVGYVTASGMLPVIVFLLLGGVIADRLPRQQVVAGANVLQALAQAGSAALVLSGRAEVWELMALAAVRGIGLGFDYPAGLPAAADGRGAGPAAGQRDRPDRPEHRADHRVGAGRRAGRAGRARLGPGAGRGQLRGGRAAAHRHADGRPARGEAGRMLHELRKGGRSSPPGAGCGPSCWSSRCWSRCGTGRPTCSARWSPTTSWAARTAGGSCWPRSPPGRYWAGC